MAGYESYGQHSNFGELWKYFDEKLSGIDRKPKTAKTRVDVNGKTVKIKPEEKPDITKISEDDKLKMVNRLNRKIKEQETELNELKTYKEQYYKEYTNYRDKYIKISRENETSLNENRSLKTKFTKLKNKYDSLELEVERLKELIDCHILIPQTLEHDGKTRISDSQIRFSTMECLSLEEEEEYIREIQESFKKKGIPEPEKPVKVVKPKKDPAKIKKRDEAIAKALTKLILPTSQVTKRTYRPRKSSISRK